MAGLESIFTLVGAWLGYVGSCVANPDPTCRPFLAFIALASSAAAALALILMAYKAMQLREMQEVEERRARKRALQMQEGIRRALADKNSPPRLAADRRWDVAA